MNGVFGENPGSPNGVAQVELDDPRLPQIGFRSHLEDLVEILVGQLETQRLHSVHAFFGVLVDQPFLPGGPQEIFSLGGLRIDGIICGVPLGGGLSDDHIVLPFFSSAVFVSPFPIGTAEVFVVFVVATRRTEARRDTDAAANAVGCGGCRCRYHRSKGRNEVSRYRCQKRYRKYQRCDKKATPPDPRALSFGLTGIGIVSCCCH
mmetsp:Transcript_14755/g.33918  ORF Transcript_14755/g.33918 Transcript_14755/m.33918 type:complete len:205 (-) Transcript_14755:76-690(-)